MMSTPREVDISAASDEFIAGGEAFAERIANASSNHGAEAVRQLAIIRSEQREREVAAANQSEGAQLQVLAQALIDAHGRIGHADTLGRCRAVLDHLGRVARTTRGEARLLMLEGRR